MFELFHNAHRAVSALSLRRVKSRCPLAGKQCLSYDTRRPARAHVRVRDTRSGQTLIHKNVSILFESRRRGIGGPPDGARPRLAAPISIEIVLREAQLALDFANQTEYEILKQCVAVDDIVIQLIVYFINVLILYESVSPPLHRDAPSYSRNSDKDASTLSPPLWFRESRGLPTTIVDDTGRRIDSLENRNV
ncbi:hypothetical protein EVAR_82110_1 [Eumeta japonica]|uniref:Uncharacterized protein n=1 Tax=Eumeta variegata TaxID=151549 RepID=A0A4C1U258_EUMVA|nr:hypothetical protein EVAR_82110_1 [Eumeta japonica]